MDNKQKNVCPVTVSKTIQKTVDIYGSMQLQLLKWGFTLEFSSFTILTVHDWKRKKHQAMALLSIIFLYM